MTVSTTENQPQEQKNDKEINFRKLEERYERALAQEKAAREEAEKRINELQTKKSPVSDEDDDDDDPYIDKRKLAKKFSSFEQKMEEKIERKAEEKARSMLAQEKRDSWIKNNPDFYDVMQKSDKLYMHDQELADTLLQMPEGFERQKLVYKSIKAMGLHKEPERQPSIQEKIDANKRSPYYQPSNMGSAPYGQTGDFTKSGQKNAYEKMQELKNRLRLG